MYYRLLLAAGFLAFAACAPSATSSQEPRQSAAESEERIPEAELHGRWRVVSLNGRSLGSLPEDHSDERSPHVTFSANGYGGNTGCNSFGGLGVLHGGRYYAGPAMQTAIGCGALTDQESAITGLLIAAPAVRLGADGSLTLTDGQRSMLLRRQAAARRPLGPAWAGSRILAGTIWAIGEVDGRRLAEPQHGILRFEADRWSLSGPCGTRRGNWRQESGKVVASTAADADGACDSAAAGIESALIALLSARPRFATGPNGEILLGGGGHWATGQRPRGELIDESAFLAGNWRIMAIDGRRPLPGAGSGIAFGATGYSGSAGCNSMQGYYLAQGRRFFSAPPMQTEMACIGPVGEQESRVARILTSSPSLASAGNGEIEMVSETGTLRLRRDGEAGWAPEGRAWAGEPIEAELTMIGGTALQAHHSELATRLRLSAGRFEIRSGCGRLGGILRRRDARLEFYTDAGPEPSDECAGALGRRFNEFSRMFNGAARVQIGASGELLMAGQEQWLAGRVTRPASRK